MSVKTLGRVKDGENAILFQVAGFEPIRCDINEISEGNRHKLLMHGMNAKVGDSAAGCKGKEAYAAIVSTWTNLKEGKWTERTGGGDKVSVSQIKSAISMLTPEEQAAAVAIFAKLGKKID